MDVERVVLDGLTPSEYRSLVGSIRNPRRIRQSSPSPKETSELFSLIKSKSTLPEWISVLLDVVESLHNSRTRYRSCLGVTENLAYPVMHHAWHKVSKMFVGRERIMLSRAAKDSLRKSLLARLSFTGRNPVEWMWNVLRGSSGILIESPTENSERLLCDIVFGRGVDLMVLHLFEHYPALARLWAIQVSNWIRYIGDFLVHAKTFARNHLGSLTEPIIRKVEPDRSDPHSGNRSVMQVCFEGGSHWFYKPRSGKCEKAWFTLLDWLNLENFPARFALVKIVSEGDHCWMQAVQQRQCRSRKEAARYYFRAGALLCLIHWLRGIDFHAGNIIAHGAQPVIVDCETLFHPKVPVPRSARREGRSILRTGMLPIWKPKTKLSDSVSALGRITFGSQSVRVKGKSVSASEFVDSIADGVKTMHSFLGRRYGSMGMTRMLKRLRQIQYRRIYYPTSNYCARLERSLSVVALKSGESRRQSLVRPTQPATRRARQEITSLEDADIPIFHGKAAGLRRYSIKELNQDAEIIQSVLVSTRAA
jgi:hypothetical protein